MKWFDKAIVFQHFSVGAGSFFDKYTYRGNFFHFLFLLLFFLLMWFFHDVYSFISAIFGGDPFEVSEGRMRWHRVVTVMIFLPGFITVLSLLAYVPFRRRKATESAKGQWYDNPDIKKEDLYDNERKGE